MKRLSSSKFQASELTQLIRRKFQEQWALVQLGCHSDIPFCSSSLVSQRKPVQQKNDDRLETFLRLKFLIRTTTAIISCLQWLRYRGMFYSKLFPYSSEPVWGFLVLLRGRRDFSRWSRSHREWRALFSRAIYWDSQLHMFPSPALLSDCIIITYCTIVPGTSSQLFFWRPRINPASSPPPPTEQTRGAYFDITTFLRNLEKWKTSFQNEICALFLHLKKRCKTQDAKSLFCAFQAGEM